MSSPIEPAGTGLHPGSRHALVIATSTYDDVEFRQLRAPVRDAQDLADVLGDAEIGAFTVTRITDASARDIRVAIQQFLHGRAVDDIVAVYLSCHGIRDRRGAFTSSHPTQTRACWRPLLWNRSGCWTGSTIAQRKVRSSSSIAVLAAPSPHWPRARISQTLRMFSRTAAAGVPSSRRHDRMSTRSRVFRSAE